MSSLNQKQRERMQGNFELWLKSHCRPHYDLWIKKAGMRHGIREFYTRAYQQACQAASIKRWHKQNPKGDFRLKPRGNHTQYGVAA